MNSLCLQKFKKKIGLLLQLEHPRSPQIDGEKNGGLLHRSNLTTCRTLFLCGER